MADVRPGMSSTRAAPGASEKSRVTKLPVLVVNITVPPVAEGAGADVLPFPKAKEAGG